MGWIYERQGKKRSSYYIAYRINGKIHHERIVTSTATNAKNIAKQVLSKREAELAQGKHLNKIKPILFEDFAEKYLKCKRVEKESWNKDEQSIKVFKIFFSGKYIHEITRETIDEFKINRKNEISKKTMKKLEQASVDRNLSCIKHMFNKAVEWGYLEKNPAEFVRLFRPDNARTRFLSLSEIEMLLKNSTGHLRAIIILILNLGLRVKELLALRWENIDFEHNIVWLMKTKSKKKQYVVMNNDAKEELEFLSITKEKDSEYIFSCKNKPLRYENIREEFLTVVKKSGILNVQLRDLRRTFGSHLAIKGQSLYTISKAMRHSSYAVTEQHYAHLSNEAIQSAVNKLDYAKPDAILGALRDKKQ